jgi:endoribonuclease LACTB2
MEEVRLEGEAVVPRKAAALIILNEATPPAVLLARRNDKLAFMGGQYCFPGGRILDDEDLSHVVHAPNPEVARALHAAVRETFEETGLLCVEGEAPSLDTLRAARQATIVTASAFDQLLAKFGLCIDMRRFEPAGVWVTPPISPIRFHTHYFLHRYEGPGTAEVFHGEIVDLAWLPAREARRQWREGVLETSTPVGFALQKLATEPAERVADALCRVPNTPAGVPGRFELRWGLYLIPLKTDTLLPGTHTNCVVVGEEELYVIDPGTSDAGEQAMLLDQLEHLRGRHAVGGVLLTHSHRDHVGAAEVVRDRFGCPIWAHGAVQDQVGFSLDKLLVDGEIVQVAGDPAWSLRCLHTPGHDPGHMCFLEESTGTLIAGDMVANPGSIFISEQYGGDMTAYLESLERLKQLGFDRVIPGHGIPLQAGAKRLLQQHIDHRVWREQKVAEALREGATSLNEFLHRVYGDVPAERWHLAEGNLRAHLARLGAEIRS